MRTATDKSEEKVIQNVKNHGLHIVHVMQDENNPAFSYTIGLYENYLLPEVIIIGLKHELSQILLNNIAYDIKNGKTFATGEFHEGILDNFLCYFGEVPKSLYREYVGWGMWFYDGTDFPLIQCVPPTVKGKFPWDKDFPEDAKFHLKTIIEHPKFN
jgi:Domain of unknown function (DUF4262)